MSEAKPRRVAGSRFSLRHLLTFTAMIAVGIAVGAAYRKNRLLTQYRADLLSLSSRLQIYNEDELASAAMPNVADDFYSWHVHVPDGQDYRLRLGIGDVSDKGIPPIVGTARIPAGQHRLTLHTGDSVREEFRYVVYVDGERVIDETMGGDWMPGGWTSASGINWPTGSKHIPASLQLAGQSYEPNRDFGSGHYFNGQSDNYVTRLGYRLWIDQSNIPHQAASPFIGFSEDPQYLGFGLRDGLRYLISSQTYHWTFTRPRFATTDPAIQIEAEFFASDGTVLFSQSQSFQAWQLRNVANGTDSLRWYDEPSQSTNTAFLHGLSMSDEQLQPVVEMKWDAGRPDEVGIRLADTAANDPVVRWRLRILDGSHQLWRKLQIGDRPWISPKDALDSGEVTDANPANPVIKSAILNVGDEANANLDLLLQTDETLPLQIVQRSDPRYAGLKLYQGLPLRIGVQIPPTLKPTLAVDVVDQHPTTPNTSFPGGPVFQAIRIELDAVGHDWIWLSAKSRE